MKKIIISSVLLAFASTTFCQQTVQKTTLKSDYLQKSKNQKKVGWILLGGGVVLIATGVIIPEGEATGDINWISWSYEHKNDGIKGAFILTGGLSLLGSIPFFIASGKNKRRANAISATLKIDNASIVRSYSKVNISYPALSIKLDLH